MAWKPKTIAGKILKGAVIGGGSILGLVSGIGAVSGITKGTGVLAGIGKSMGGLRNTVDKVAKRGVDLITGSSQAQRQMINAQRQQTREDQDKLDLVDKLVRAGSSPEAARAKAGLDPVQLVEYQGEKVQSAGVFDFLQNKNVLIALAGLAGIFLLLKSKRR